jgi:hypothetical protein
MFIINSELRILRKERLCCFKDAVNVTDTRKRQNYTNVPTETKTECDDIL